MHDELQPLDATVNGKYKELMRGQFQQWYAEKVATAMEEEKEI